MALAAFGEPRWLPQLTAAVHVYDGVYEIEPIDFGRFAPPVHAEAQLGAAHADLASSVQTLLENVLLELAGWLHEQTGERKLTMAGGVALNCVANSRIYRESPFDEVWVQPAAGDSGTALGAALYASQSLGDDIEPMVSTALGREWSDTEIESILDAAQVPYTYERDIGGAVAELIAQDKIVGWFEGRSEFGPRALGRRSLLADPRRAENLDRMNNVKGREQFRPIAPMVLERRAPELFDSGPLPSPYMLFTHQVNSGWADKVPAALHTDLSARVQTVGDDEPLISGMLESFDALTGVPVVINTSFNTAGRPIVDHPRDALECFGSSPIDAVAIGSHLLKRQDFAAKPQPAGTA
jgi:carbamoyltransferase